MESGRTLETVVSELDMILRNHLCSKTQLIRAIETQLNIQLLSGGTKEEQDNIQLLSGGTKEKQDDIRLLSGGTKEKQDEIRLLGGRTKEEQDDIQLVSGGTKEEQDDIKPRSGTVICNDDDSDNENEPIPSVLHTRTQSSPSLPRKPYMYHPRTLSSSHIPLTKVEHGCYDNTSNGDCYRQDGGRCYSNEWNLSTPLKRKNAQKRRASTAEDVGVVTLYSDGHGVFTHAGGTLTIQVSNYYNYLHSLLSNYTT